MDDVTDPNLIRPMEFLESMAKSNKKDNSNNMLQNVISNGQTFSLTEAGKLVLNTYKDTPHQPNSSTSTANSTPGSKTNNKLITIVPQSNSQIVVLSNNNQNINSKPDSAIKVVKTKPVFTEIKNAKAIPVNKLPFFQNAKSGSPVIKRYVLTNNPNQQSTKDDEVKKLQEEIKNLKQELDDYKELIIAKDLEIEKLKKKFNALNTTTNNNV